MLHLSPHLLFLTESLTHGSFEDYRCLHLSCQPVLLLQQPFTMLWQGGINRFNIKQCHMHQKEALFSYKQAQDVQTVVKRNNLFCASPNVTLRLLWLRSRTVTPGTSRKAFWTFTDSSMFFTKIAAFSRDASLVLGLQCVNRNIQVHSQQYRSCHLLINTGAMGEGIAKSRRPTFKAHPYCEGHESKLLRALV